MPAVLNFAPRPKSRKTITVSSSSQRVQLSAGQGEHDVYVYNKGTADAQICFGDSTVAASATLDMSCPSGSIQVLRGVPATTDGLYVAVIAAGATGDIEFTLGCGS